ncbi:SAM-dependent methyltransferase [Actinoplanes couchii]|nr:SAM-dependent methyltransferase [Actinoplanes couchii]
MINRIAKDHHELLDVGIGTGIAARQFRDAGCEVLGVEPDPRMAAVARRYGFPVEESRIEDWDPQGRTFDAVVAGQTWHWVDPVAGAAKAYQVLRPGGRLALFWNAVQPSKDLAEGFGAAYRRAAPSLPFDPWAVTDPYATIVEKASEHLRDPEVWRFTWDHEYTREEWLDQIPTAGGHGLLPPAELEALLTAIGEAVGDRFTMRYQTVVVTTVKKDAVRKDAAR